jgi:metal transporter CNNM
LIGEEIYDEFDAEGQSNLKAYVAPKSMKARGRQRDRHIPANASENATAVDGQSTVPSFPNTPKIMAANIPESTPSMSRTPSTLEQVVSTLVTRKKNQNLGAAGEPRPSSVSRSLRPHRLSSKQRAARSETDLPTTLLAPSAGIVSTDRVSDVHEHDEHEDEEGIRIPGPRERSGPDIGGNGKKAGDE